MTYKPRILILIACSAALGCAGTAITRDTFVRIPEHPSRAGQAPDVRGTARDAARIAPDQQFVILGEVVRRFYRPMMQQARWIDPQPLAHHRTRQADSLVAANGDWAIAIVDAARAPRICPLNEANSQCGRLAGGILRFSPPYAVGTRGADGADSALVYARYTPVRGGTALPTEIEFFVARRDSAWRVISMRTMPEIVATSASGAGVSDPQSAVDALLSADRAFAATARTTDMVTAIANMFVTNVVMLAPSGQVRGRDAAIQALNANPVNKQSRVEWTPVRGGVSSDGEHGFTLGYLTVTRADGVVVPSKYVAYWVRGDAGWRVAAYKRGPRPAGDVSLALLPPSLPQRALPRGDSATVQRYADELSLAEHAFSKDAQPMGLGPAFEKWGAPDAMNAGGPNHAEFVRGPEAIARSVSEGITPGMQITWAPEQVIVASTGDLGVSIGTIRITAPATAGNAVATREVPFFTIWKRLWPTDTWRYVAE